jgi:hypothetical protein
MTTQDDPKTFEEPAERRWLLLWKALECMPLEKAIDLARAAEAFVTGARVESPTDYVSARLEPVAMESEPVAMESEPVVMESTGPAQEPLPPAPEAAISSKSSGSVERDAKPHGAGAMTSAVSPEPTSARRSNLTLSVEQREQLLQRLAMGAKNADLTHQFGLSMQQVQGVRMGSAREIAARRERLRHGKPVSDEPRNIAPIAEDIVRYLRQQDDVVVPQGNGEFVVNGRFHLPISELVTRANKMRRRQGKPEFGLVGSPPVVAPVRAANGHPLF